MNIKTEVGIRGKQRYWWGQSLPRQIHTLDETITQGLAQRIARYAAQRLNDTGMLDVVREWELTVYTIDGDEKPADRSYCVRLTNSKGGYIEVIGILTRHGWPSLDHGLSVGER